MFDVSWGELLLLTGVGLVFVGKRDLPKAANYAGTQVGRLVGLMQGARARADQYSSQNELRQLQNELRSGLRELDAVKTELAVSMSGRGMVGHTLGATVPGVNRQQPQQFIRSTPLSLSVPPSTVVAPLTPGMPQSSSMQSEFLPPQPRYQRVLPDASQTIGAVAEDSWERQGTSFRSRAEQGVGLSNFNASSSGSALLANLMKDSLIFDQYDRVAQQQDAALQSKINTIKQKAQEKKSGISTRTKSP